MSKKEVNLLFAVALLVFVSLACGKLGKNNTEANANANSVVPVSNNKTKTTDNTDKNAAVTSTSGAEKQKPAAGKGNVQGKVLFNEQPVEGIEVKICETFSTIMGIKCEGKTLTTKTDKDGVFVLADLEPKTYGGLTAKVFTSPYYVYPQKGIMSAQTFAVAADQTIFASDIHLFKNDVKITNPKAGAKAPAENLELKWDAYPGAAYYKISLLADGGFGAPPISNERVDDPAYTVSEPLTNGKYRLQVIAFNANDRKLAESPNDIKFTVTGGAEPAPKQ